MHMPTLLQVAIALDTLYFLNKPAPVALSKSMTDISRHKRYHQYLQPIRVKKRYHPLGDILTITTTMQEATFNAAKRVARRRSFFLEKIRPKKGNTSIRVKSIDCGRSFAIEYPLNIKLQI